MNLRRLRHMTTNEIAHRLRERIRREADRFRFRAGCDRNADDEFEALIARHGRSLKSYFDYGPARRFYPSTHDRDAASQFIIANFPEWLERSIHQAGILCEHRVDLLGFTDVPLG